MRPALPLIPWLLLLISCSSPPKPPTVDESRKRPANAAVAVELQACKSDLANTRILANESARAAATSAAVAAGLAQQQAIAAQAKALPDTRNTLYTVTVAFGSAKVSLPDAEAAQLAEETRTAPLVLLRGRTDGVAESAAESRIARERAIAVRDFLVQAGVDPARIRPTWQPVGDHAAENGSAGGRALNRRVEIEVYRVAPRMAPLASSASASASASASM